MRNILSLDYYISYMGGLFAFLIPTIYLLIFWINKTHYHIEVANNLIDYEQKNNNYNLKMERDYGGLSDKTKNFEILLTDGKFNKNLFDFYIKRWFSKIKKY